MIVASACRDSKIRASNSLWVGSLFANGAAWRSRSRSMTVTFWARTAQSSILAFRDLDGLRKKDGILIIAAQCAGEFLDLGRRCRLAVRERRQPVPQGVAAGARLASRRPRAAALAAIAPVRFDFAVRRHGSSRSPWWGRSGARRRSPAAGLQFQSPADSRSAPNLLEFGVDHFVILLRSPIQVGTMLIQEHTVADRRRLAPFLSWSKSCRTSALT